MGMFFNGRYYVSPAVVSAVDDSAMFDQGASVGNTLLLIGQSTGGLPNTPLPFGSPAEAIATLRSGELMEACRKAFSPSNETGGPSKVIAIRVNPAVQSTMQLLDAQGTPTITITSKDAGLYTSQIKVKIENATLNGLKLTQQLSQNYTVQDNVYRNAFSVQYNGVQASATMTVGESSVTLFAPAGTQVASIDLTQFPTVGQLADRINGVTIAGVQPFSATVLDGNSNAPALNGLDAATTVDVKTAAYTATAHVQAVVDYLNSASSPYINATRLAGSDKVPALIPFTYLTGGSDGVTTLANWSNAFTTAQTVDAQWLTPLSSNPAIAAMADAHVQYMSTIAFMERRSIVGTALGTTDSAGVLAAKALNSDRTGLVHLGYYGYDVNGNYTLFQPYMTAALVAAGFAGLSPGEAMTNKSLTVSGFERVLRNPTDTDALIQGGVIPLESNSSGYVVTQSVSTWLTNSNYNRVELSCGAALDYVSRTVRDAIKPMLGKGGTPLNLSAILARADTALRLCATAAPAGPGVLVGDAKSPAYKNLTAQLNGNRVSVSFQGSPVIPINYEDVTIHAVPYSGTASA
ncbi:hypothetical protein [Burkholderia sp. Ac-20349]|uniref:hypothetical protein n=1 Tax=Burkholderia sp. Ac-20349 TaxID=2703893 RepID=UPI00197BF01E|nr:hypothetical protein [Burkholderia sp. Ac-20349]MBN3839280.1 hypothetical protein [Burkholderia sp. Ac-20349]